MSAVEWQSAGWQVRKKPVKPSEESIMKAWPKEKKNGTGLYRSRFARILIAYMALMFLSLATKPAIAAAEDEVRATFDRFVAAQNARHQSS